MGAQIAQKFQSTVLVLHTYDPNLVVNPASTGGGWEYSPSSKGIDAEAAEMGRALTEPACKLLLEAGVKCGTCSNAVGPSKPSRALPNSTASI